MRKTAIFWMVLLGGLALQPAFADPGERREQRQERREPRMDSRLGPGEAARLAQAQNGGGRVLDVDATPDGYRVKLLKQGEVRVVFIPNSP